MPEPTRGWRSGPRAPRSPAVARGRPAVPAFPQAHSFQRRPRPHAYAYATDPSLDRKQQRPRKLPGPLVPVGDNLLQRSVDRGELRVQVGAEAIDDRDDRERDPRSNQAVFDGGGARLVLHETRNQVLHKLNSMYTW